MSKPEIRKKKQASRREFLETTGAALVAATAAPVIQAQTPATPAVPRTAIRINVNGASQRVEVEDRWTLVELLRDHLKLTGTKIGCDRGECGACTVLLDGKPVYSCSQLAVWMDGRSVQTVEGAGAGRQARSAAASVHGARRAAVRLLHLGPVDERQGAARRAILIRLPRKCAPAMTGNICRCSNYNRYVEAASRRAPATTAVRSKSVSRSAASAATLLCPRSRRSATRPRASTHANASPARPPTRGDVQLPGMLYARVLRSPHPHARIRKIDASKALALPGVKAVLTHENCTGRLGRGRRSPAACSTTTRSRRSPSSGATRSTIRCASSASRWRPSRRSTGTWPKKRCACIAVDYEVLPFVLDPEEALKPGAVQIWPEGNLSLDSQNEAKPIDPAARQRRARLPRVRPRLRGSLHDHVRAQRADGAARLRRASGKATS